MILGVAPKEGKKDVALKVIEKAALHRMIEPYPSARL